MNAHREIKANDHVLTDVLWSVKKQFSDQLAEQVNVHHMMKTLPIEMSNVTVTHLDHLNEDCLLEIFSRKALTPMDLCSLAETCKLFKQIALRVFPKTLTIHKKYPEYSIISKDNRRTTESIQNVERIFKSFGRCLIALTINGGGIMTNILTLVAKHCVVGTLKELEIGDTKILRESEWDLKPIIQQLETLKMRNTMCNANVFSDCESLIELSVSEIFRHEQIMANNYPKLQRFTLEIENDITIYSLEMLAFLERHKTLKCLHLRSDCGFIEIKNIFPELGWRCMELEELEIRSDEYGDGEAMTTTLEFSSFTSLRRLKLVFPFKWVKVTIVGLQNAKSLEVLKIDGKFAREGLLEALPLLKNLSELSVNLDFISGAVPWTSVPQLRKLRLTGSHHVIDNVVDIIKQMSNLEELKIRMYNRASFVLSEKEFFEIVELTKVRRNVLTLRCPFKFSQSSENYKRNCHENLKVKLAK